MTELEQLATNLETKITLEWYTRVERIYPQLLDAITAAYALGKSHATSPARRDASRRNGAKNTAGRKPGAKDKRPRTRRTKAELAQARQQEMTK